jgi:hypothetical protein
MKITGITFLYNQKTDHMLIGLLSDKEETKKIDVDHWTKIKTILREIMYEGENPC